MKVRIFDANCRMEITSGYGLMSLQLSAALESFGHEVCFYPDDGKGEDVVLWIRPPHYLGTKDFNPEKKNVIYTMHEKETFEGWKSDWPDLLNKCLAVIVPTQWNKGIFEKNGVKVPIYVVPLGINSKDFHGYKTYRFSIMTLHDALGKDTSRENWKDTLQAYYETFTGFHNKEVELTIKSYNINYDGLNTYKQSLIGKTVADKVPDVNIIDLELTPGALNKLYSKHWLFVKNANREGWCLPLWEAITCGVDVAFTNLPVFEEVKIGTRFETGDIKALKDIFLDKFKYWQRSKNFINLYKWTVCARKVEEILKNVQV